MLRSRNVFSSSQYCAAVTKIFDVSIKPKVIYVGVDMDRFHPDTLGSESRKKLDLPSEAQIILTVARMETEMGVPAILKIAERVLLGSPTAIFVIAGAKGAATPLVEDAAKMNGGRLFCRVDVPSDDLPHYYAASTIVIAPTVGVHACMGVSVKEAMAAGKPVVVSNSGGLPEAVEHRITGIIVQLMDTGEIDTTKFADSIVALMQDTETGNAMGQKGRLRAEKIFSANATTDSFIKLITDIRGSD
jgi:starch synthase